uniref:Uncharacterized protein n=1 Tax=Trichuris muris TaxID=70415 RepID=A0A5S6QAM7_TRIMR
MMDNLNEDKVQCLLNWLNLETASAFPPVKTLDQLRNFERISWFVAELSASDEHKSYVTPSDSKSAITSFLRRWYDSSVFSCLEIGSDGKLLSSNVNVAGMLALLLNYALAICHHNSAHVELVRSKMDVKDQWIIMNMCTDINDLPAGDWLQILKTTNSPLSKASSSEMTLSEKSMAENSYTANNEISEPSRSTISCTPNVFESPITLCNKVLSDSHRVSIRKKFELVQEKERYIAGKQAELHDLSMEVEQLKIQLRNGDAKNSEVLSLLDTEKRNHRTCQHRLAQTEIENQELRAENEGLTRRQLTLSKKFDALTLRVQEQQVELEAFFNENEALRSQLSRERMKARSWHEEYLAMGNHVLINQKKYERINNELLEHIEVLKMEKKQMSDKLDEEINYNEILRNKCSAQQNYIKQELTKFRNRLACMENGNDVSETCDTWLRELVPTKEQTVQLSTAFHSCVPIFKEPMSPNGCSAQILCSCNHQGVLQCLHNSCALNEVTGSVCYHSAPTSSDVGRNVTLDSCLPSSERGTGKLEPPHENCKCSLNKFGDCFEAENLGSPDTTAKGKIIFHNSNNQQSTLTSPCRDTLNIFQTLLLASAMLLVGLIVAYNLYQY